MSSTGKLVVSFEADPPPVCYSPELQALEDKIRAVLEAYAQDTHQAASGRDEPAGNDDRTGLIQRGNSFILTIGFDRRSFDFLIESLIGASKGAWLLVYGGLDGEGSIMLELQDGRVVTRRERVPVDTLNDRPGAREEEDSSPPEADDLFPY